MSQLVKPSADAVENMLEMLFGDGTAVTSVEPSSVVAVAAARYVDDEDSLAALCACDAPFLAYSGAALSMMPCSVPRAALWGSLRGGAQSRHSASKRHSSSWPLT